MVHIHAGHGVWGTIMGSSILTASRGPYTDPVPCQDTRCTGPNPASRVKCDTKAV